ncbi:MAG TPA: hypothetical protein VF753_06215 [Terriglobales bacterium]
MRDATGDRPSAVLTVLWIGLVAGTLDISENIIFNYFRGITPKMIFQYIASGLIGMRSIQMGAASVALGVVIHCLIALTWTTIFYLASRRIPALTRHPVISGLTFGGVVYLVMNFAVLTLTAVPHVRAAKTPAALISAVLALLLCIGLPISWLVKRFAPPGPLEN